MKSSAKTWFAVTANYKAVHLEKVRRRHLWEQLVFLVQAKNEDEAQIIGYSVAKSKEHQYKAIKGDQILWQFTEIIDIKELIDQELKQGMEVNWRFFERVDKPMHKGGD